MITRREYHRKNPIPFILTTLLIVSTVGLFVFGEKATQHTSAEEVVAVDYRQQFINNIASTAQELALANDLYPSVMIAQAIHESNYGLSGLGSYPHHNLFGIKGAYNGQSVKMETWEEDAAGNAHTILADFRAYPSYRESLQDYVAIMRQSWFAGAWKSHAATYQDATNALTGTYATDSAYAAKLNYIIELHGLTQYDGVAVPATSDVNGFVWNPHRSQYTTQETLNLDEAWVQHVNSSR